MFTKKTTLIIPTYNRSEKVGSILSQLKKFKINFFEIIIVDSSNKYEKKKLKNICKRHNVKIINSFQSTSHQRNLGLKNKNKNTKFIMFLDDDLIFYKNSFREMNKFINNNKKTISGYSFNHFLRFNKKNNLLEKIKTSKISYFFGLYINKPGIVMNSGWHTKIINLKKNTYVQWLPAAALVLDSAIIKNKSFDESFGAYSYLEDLDFSLNIKDNQYKFAVVSKAKFLHPNNIIRVNFIFGYFEIINRFKIVDKYKLNKFYFFYMGFIKTFYSLFSVFSGNINYILKFLGNFIGLIKCIGITIYNKKVLK
jgi:glycosyltransferase involved in cell wall biosynthesis